MSFQYPPARRDAATDDFHGTIIPDPYRWLEQPESAETQAWVAAENELTEQYLAAIPARERIKARLTELWNYPKWGVPARFGAQYFWSKNDGLQNQAVVYRAGSLDAEPTELLDPNRLSEDGTLALTSQHYSHDGALLAYGASQSGSDWQTIRVRRTADGTEFDDEISWCKFAGVAWRHDNSGFFYNRFPTPGTVAAADHSNYNRVYWHTLGTAQADDELIYERPDAKELSFTPSMTDDGQFLILSVWHGTDTNSRLYYRPADGGEVVRLLDDADAMYSFVGSVGRRFIVHTDRGAPHGTIVAIDLDRPAPADGPRWSLRATMSLTTR